MATTQTNTVSYEGRQATELLFNPEVMPTIGLEAFRVLTDVTEKMQVPEIAGLTKLARDGAACATTTVGAVTITDKTIAPQPVAFNAAFCKRNFLPSYLGSDFTGNTNDFLGTELAEAFEQRFTQGVMQDIYDNLFWGNADATTDTEVYLRDHDVSGLYLSWNGGGNMNQVSDFSTGLASGFTTGTATSDYTLNADEGWDILENLINNQDLKLVGRTDKVFHVTWSIYNNLRKSLNGYSTSASALQVVPNEVINGVEVLSYQGIPIITHPRWDEVLRTNTAIGFVHFAVLTVNENNLIGLDGDNASANIWYSLDDDQIKMRSNISIDVELAHTELYAAYKAV